MEQFWRRNTKLAFYPVSLKKDVKLQKYTSTTINLSVKENRS